MIKINKIERKNVIICLSLCSCLILHQNIVHLQLRFDLRTDRVLLVSVSYVHDEYDRNQENNY